MQHKPILKSHTQPYPIKNNRDIVNNTFNYCYNRDINRD